PMASAHYPAGSGRIAGNEPRAANSTKVNPTILHACADVKILGFKENAKRRKLSDAASHKKNTTIGVSAPIATPSPMRFAPFSKTCRAEADKAKMNQTAMSPIASFP